MTVINGVPETSAARSPVAVAAFASSVVVMVLAAAAALAGLLADGAYPDPAAVAQMLRGFDLVTLVVVAGLVAALYRARHGADRAYLVWAGLLAYVAYTYAYHAFGTTFGDLFLLHVAVLGSAVFALVSTVAAADVRGIAQRFSARTPVRVAAAVLGLLAVSLGGMWIYAGVRYAITAEVPAGSALVEPDGVVQLGIALDLAVLVPAYSLAAVLLWRRAAWGYLAAAVVLVSGTLHQVSYVVALAFQASADVPGAVAFDPVEPVIVLLYVVAVGILLLGAGRGLSDRGGGSA